MTKNNRRPLLFFVWIRGWIRDARLRVRQWRQRLPAPVKRVLRRVTHISAHSVLGILIAFALIVGLAHMWLPTLAERKGEIEAYVTSTAGSPVQFEALDTFWDGLNPGIRVQGFRLYSQQTRQVALELREVRLSLAWWPLITGRIEINSLVLVEPNLTLERLADGRIRITGIEVQAAADPGQEDFGSWLLRQRQMIIQNGQLIWQDRHADPLKPEKLVLRRVNIAMQNDGDRHRLDMQADFPETLCASCSLSADITGKTLRDAKWRGEIRLSASRLSVSGLPQVLRAKLPADLDGHFDLRLVSRWRNGIPVQVGGSAEARQLSLPVPGMEQPVQIRHLATTLDWQGEPERWRLDLGELRVGLTQSPWSAGHLRLDRRPDGLLLTIDRVNVADLADFAGSLPREDDVLRWLRAAKPQGSLDGFEVRLTGPLTAPKDFRLQTRLRNIQVTAHERFPGVRGLNGRLSVLPGEGELQVDSRRLELELPRIFREPFERLQLSSRIRWRQNPEDWVVKAEQVALSAPAGRVQGDAELRLPKDKGLSPELKLHMEVKEADGTYTSMFLPRMLPAPLLAYLENAVVAGRVTGGSIDFHGAVRNFPFRDGKGRFEVRAHVEDGVYEYLPGWVPLRHVEADLYFTGIGMQITASRATLRDLEVRRVAVGIEDYLAPAGAQISVHSRIAGSLDTTLDVLAESGSPRLTAWLMPGMQATGNGVLNLELNVPARTPVAFTLAGDFRFHGNDLGFPVQAIRAERLRGGITFNETGLRSGTIHGQLLGNEAVFAAAPDDTRAGATRVALHGRIASTALASAFGARIASRLSGDVPWQAQLSLRPDGNTWNADFDLHGLEMRFPAPLAKARDEPLLLKLRGPPAASRDVQLLEMQAGGRMSGRLAFVQTGKDWSFSKGRIGFGEIVRSLPSEEGLQLTARLPALNADAWWQILGQDTGTGGAMDAVSRVAFEADAFELFDRPFGRMLVDVNKRSGNWHGRIQGDTVAGELALTRARCVRAAGCKPPEGAAEDGLPAMLKPGIRMTLERLFLAAARGQEKTADLDPRDLPNLDVTSKAFRLAGRDLGSLDLAGRPDARGWRVKHLRLQRPEAQFSARGTWQIDKAARQSSRFDLSATSSDFGQTLTSIGYPGEAVRGNLLLESQLSWPGSPTAMELAALSGELSFKLTQGRLLKIEPGTGRLLGVLDFASLARYLSLDFTSLFGKGLTYNAIQGNLEIENGNAYTRNLSMRSSGADIDLSGRIGFGVRDVDLEMQVTPKLLEELAVTGTILGGPAVGAAVAVLHGLIKKPLEQSTRVKFTVTGTWDKPLVTRIGAPQTPATEEP